MDFITLATLNNVDLYGPNGPKQKLLNGYAAMSNMQKLQTAQRYGLIFILFYIFFGGEAYWSTSGDTCKMCQIHHNHLAIQFKALR